MSVYVTAHGRYTGGTSCKKHSILDDPVRVRKDLENERRIQRLRQVREESNNLARKIRQEVDDEKNRQLKTLEAIKTKELKCWKEHVLAKKNDDYRAAVYQVGAAHRAAKAENEEREKQKELKQQRNHAINECRRRQAQKQKAVAATPAKKSKVMKAANCCECRNNQQMQKENKNKKTKSQPTNCCGCHSNKDKINRNLDTEETCMSKSEERSKTKRKRNTGCGVSKNCSCRYSDESYDNDDACSVSSSDTTTSSLHLWQDSDSSNDEEGGKREEGKSNKKSLQKTPALILDLNVDTDDIVTVTTHGGGQQQQQEEECDVEINDNHVDINRRFCRVIQNSSDQSIHSSKGRTETETKSSSTSNAQSSEATKRPTKLRFTQISELIKRSSTTLQGDSQETTTATTTTATTLTQSLSTQDSSSKIVVQEKVQRISKSPPRKLPTSNQTTKSSMKQVMKKAPPQRQSLINEQRTRTAPPSQKSTLNTQKNKPKNVSLLDKDRNSTKIGGRSHTTEATSGRTPSIGSESHTTAGTPMSMGPAAPCSPTKRSLSSATVVLQNGDDGGTVPNTSGRVQFYDYNNKFEKEYIAQSARSIKSNVDNNAAGTQLNAMDHAQIENQLQILRQKEIDKLRRITEERGRKALEREQVRRDCEMLTEKLDALQRQHPQLLANDANFVSSHRFVDLTNRREKKMDELMEEMLLRPAIITCPTVTPSKQKFSNGLLTTPQQAPSTINVGDHWSAVVADNGTNSSDSCTTILLDSVDNQTNQLRRDIKENGQLNEKAEKLNALLEKVELIRVNLMKELQTGDGDESPKVDSASVQQIIETIRQERTNILSEKEKSIQARESELLKREAILDQKIKEAYEAKRLKEKQAAEAKRNSELNKKKSISRTKINADGHQVLKHTKDKPLEIIIKVTGDGLIKECTAKTKGLDENGPSITKVFNEELRQPDGKKSPVNRERQNSYDSNSTVYRSLPTEINNQVHAIIEKLSQPKHSPRKAENENAKSRPETTAKAAHSTTDGSPRQNVKENTKILNPIICGYVQRLLGMHRSSIQELTVSSSDLTTPSSSLINTLSNISRHNNTTLDESLIDERNIQRIQSFIEDNRSFVTELEDTLRTHSNQSLEKSLRAFDDVWNQRLKKSTNSKKDNQSSVSGKVNLVCPCPQERKPTQSNNVKSSVSKRSTPRSHLNQDENLSGRRKQQQQQQQTAAPNKQQSYQRCDVISIGSSPAVAGTQSSDQQLEDFVELTQTCTQRISQLTDLILKVREEKQRLMEVTLTTEGEQNSTEYFDLPQGNKPSKPTDPRSRTISDQSRSSDFHGGTPPSTASESMPLCSEVEPLQKHKPIGISCDSGIYDSRPMTSHGHHAADPEIQSTNATNTTTMTSHSYYTSSNQRRSPPPLTHAHDLSTIAEVDTPMPSAHHHQHNRTQYNNPNSTLSDLRTLTTRNNVGKHCEPIRFPTFEQYAQEINLDVTSMNTEQTIRLEHQFRELIIAINEKCDHSINYQEFPTIGSYLHNVTATRISFDANDTTECNSPRKIRELIERFKLANINVRSFPPPREYMHQIIGNSQGEECQLFDTSSLENLSEPKHKCCSCNNQNQHHRNHYHSNGTSPPDTTDSFNVEAELKKRKLLKNSFQRDRVTSSTQLDGAAFYGGTMPTESGIEKLSSSQHDRTSSEIDRDLQRLGMQWPTTMRQRQREADALSSGSNYTAVNPLSNRRQRKRHNKEGETNTTGEIGRTLNLREFLTKELLKHTHTTGSTSSEDSLKSNFLNSVIESLTPNGCGTGTGVTLERQKTSTPVVSTTPRTGGGGKRSSSSTTSQLFSGESHLSSVRVCRLPTQSISTSSTTSATSKSSSSSSSKHSSQVKFRM